MIPETLGARFGRDARSERVASGRAKAEPAPRAAIRELGELDRVDDALTGVYWALSTKPLVYDCVVRDVRLLKTDPLGGLPALSVWFRIADDDTVELLHIEPTEEDGL